MTDFHIETKLAPVNGFDRCRARADCEGQPNAEERPLADDVAQAFAVNDERHVYRDGAELLADQPLRCATSRVLKTREASLADLADPSLSVAFFDQPDGDLLGCA